MSGSVPTRLVDLTELGPGEIDGCGGDDLDRLTAQIVGEICASTGVSLGGGTNS